jgi:hypothetical protein
MNIKKIAVLFSLVLCAVRMNAQEKSLEEIQKQVRDLQSQFTTHYNSVFVDYKTKISQGQDQIQRLQVRKQAELDSLELLKSKFQSDFDRDKVFYQNHEMISELTNLANSAIDKGLLLNDMESFKSYCKEGFSGSLIDCYTSNKGVVALFITEEKYLKKLDNILGDIATIRILFWFEKQNYIFTLDNLSFSNFKKSRNFYFNKSEEEIEKSNEIEKFIEKYKGCRESSRFNSSTVSYLYSTYMGKTNFQVEFNVIAENIKNEFKVIDKKYPLLKHIGTHIRDLAADYINLIDTQKGI